jgi:TonB family protein
MRPTNLIILVLVLSSCAASPPKQVTQPPPPISSPVATAPSRQTSPVPQFLAPLDTPAKLDPKHPLHIGEEYYPIESKRLGEEGTCVLRLQVDSDGYIRATQLLSSTGYQRLNAACLSSSKDGRVIPATVAGKPTASWFLFRVNWKLVGSTFADKPRIRDDYYLKVGPDYYPPLSLKLHQEGDCIVRVTVEKDGPPSTVTITKSTGYAPLDEACLAALKEAPFIAATQTGVASQASTDIGITWQLPSP